MDQNGQRANQNAERLHGSGHSHWVASNDEQSGCLTSYPIPLDEKKSLAIPESMSGKPKSKAPNAKTSRNVNLRPSTPKTVVKEVISFSPKKEGGRHRASVGSNVSNPYARILLNPEFEENVGIPDWFDQPTHKWTSILNVDVPVSATGDFQVVVQPDLEDALFMAYRSTSVSAEIIHASTPLVTPTISIGPATTQIFDYREKFLYSNKAFNDFNKSGVVDSEVVLWSASRGDPLAPGAEHAILMPTSVGGQEGVIPVGGAGFICNVWLENGTTDQSMGIRLEGIDAAGSALTAVGANFFGTGGLLTATSTAFAGTAAFLTRIVLIQNREDGGSAHLKDLRIGLFSTSPPNASLADYYLESSPVQDFSTYSNDFVAVRVVAESALMTYRGKALEGGFVAARRFQSEQPPSYSRAPALPYPTLAARPGAYDGVVNTGSYCFWLPNNFASFSFRPVSTAMDNFTEGFLAFAGRLTDPSQSALRIRVALAMEGITYKQMYHLSPCLVDSDMVNKALSVLSTVPSAMENDLHWSTIAGYLKQGAKAVGKQLWDNRAAVADVAGKAAGLSPGVRGAITRLVGAI
nr:MAG: hypothetical protein [Chemarfal virus 187]